MNCPVTNCRSEVTGPLKVCRNCWAKIPRPQQQALSSFARVHKNGPAHQAAFARAIESIHKTLEFHQSLASPIPEAKQYWNK